MAVLDSHGFLPSLSVLHNVIGSSDSDKRPVFVIKAKESCPVPLRGLDLHDVRSDLIDDLIPVQRNALFYKPQ